MVNVRRGINIRVGFSVYRNGIPEDMAEAQNIRVVVRHKSLPNSSAAFTGSAVSILGNSLSVIVTDAMQKTMASGAYLIEVAYRLINPLAPEGYDPYIIDSDVFTLTDRSSDVGGVSCGDVTVQVVNISGEVSFSSQALEQLIDEAIAAVQAANEAAQAANEAAQAANDAADAAMGIVNSKINIDGLNANVKRLQFDTTNPTAPTGAGQIAWSDDEHTLVLNDGLHTHPIGQEIELRARNTSGATILNGRACYVTGSTGDNPTIALATNTNGDVAQKTIGVATMDIANNAFGIVTTFGEVNDIDTSALTLGAIVYLGANGLLTTTEPVAPTPKIVVGLCVRQHAQVGKLFVSTRPIARLSKLSDVFAPTLTDNDVLRWNGTTFRWEVYSLVGKADLVAGKVPTSQLPSYVDDVLEYATLAAFPVTGESGKIYVALNTNLTYRWSGTAYVEISKSLALGETADTAYRGDRGKTAYDHSQAVGNLHSTTAAQIPNTPAGTVAATTVQGAINELAGDIVQVETDLNLLNVDVNGFLETSVFPVVGGISLNENNSKITCNVPSGEYIMTVNCGTTGRSIYTFYGRDTNGVFHALGSVSEGIATPLSIDYNLAYVLIGDATPLSDGVIQLNIRQQGLIDTISKSNIGLLINYNGLYPLQFSYTNKTVTIPSGTRLFYDTKKIDVIGGVLDLTTVTSSGIIVYNLTKSIFEILPTTNNNLYIDSIIVAAFTGLGASTNLSVRVSTPTPYVVDGMATGLSNVGMIYNKNGFIKFSKINGTCTIPSNSRVIINGNPILVSSGVTIDIKDGADCSGYIVFNKTTKVFSSIPWTGNLSPNEYIFIASYTNFNPLVSNKAIVNTPSYYEVDGKPYGIQESGIDFSPQIISPEYESIILPNGISWWSDFIHIKINNVDEMWFFSPSSDELHMATDGIITRVNMLDWSIIGTIQHNFGHCNTCHYDSKSDVLLIGNLPGNSEFRSACYIFYNVSDFSTLPSVDFNNADKTIVDISSTEITQTACCFAENNGGKRNIIWAYSGYSGKTIKILLGMGANDLGSGSYDNTQTEDNKYNGTYKIITKKNYNLIYDDLIEVIQGIDYFNGAVVTSNGHGIIRGFLFNQTNDIMKRREIRIETYSENGDYIYNTSEGLCVIDEYIYQGAIPVTTPSGTVKDESRGFKLIKYKYIQ